MLRAHIAVGSIALLIGLLLPAEAFAQKKGGGGRGGGGRSAPSSNVQRGGGRASQPARSPSISRPAAPSVRSAAPKVAVPRQTSPAPRVVAPKGPAASTNNGPPTAQSGKGTGVPGKGTVGNGPTGKGNQGPGAGLPGNAKKPGAWEGKGDWNKGDWNKGNKGEWNNDNKGNWTKGNKGNKGNWNNDNRGRGNWANGNWNNGNWNNRNWNNGYWNNGYWNRRNNNVWPFLAYAAIGNLFGNPYGGYGYGWWPYVTGYLPFGGYGYSEPGVIIQEAAPAAQANGPATIEVILPDPNAQVSIDGRATTSVGTSRRYVTPALETGYDYQSTIRATWEQDGEVRTVERTLPLRSGGQVTVDFTRSPSQVIPGLQSKE